MSATPSGESSHRFKVEKIMVEEVAVLRCSGRVTGEVSQRLKTEVQALLPHTKRIALDLRDVDYMDSAGLGAVVRLYVIARNSGAELRLMNLGPRIRDLLGLTHVLSLLEACANFGVKLP